MDFWRLVELLNQRKWLIFVSVAVTMALTFGATRLVGSVWVATARLMAAGAVVARNVDDAGSDPAAPPDPGGLAAKAQAAAYEAVAKSSKVLEPALKAVGLTEAPPDLLKNIKVEAAGRSLYDLKVFDPKPARAEKLVNAIARSFVRQSGTFHTKQIQDAVQMLQEQLAAADARLAVARRHADAYKREHGIVGDLASTMTRDLTHLDTMRQRREEVQEKLTAAEAKLREREVELEQTPQTVLVHHQILMPNGAFVQAGAGGNPRLHDLQQQVAQAEQELAKLRKNYTDESPLVKEALARRNSAQSDLDAEQAKTGGTQKPAAPAKPAPSPSAARGATMLDEGSPEPNPAFQSLRLAVGELRQEISGSHAELAALDTALTARQQDTLKYQGVDGPLSTIMSEVNQQSEARTQLAARLQTGLMALDAAQRVPPLRVLDESGKYNQPVNSTSGRTQRILLIGALCALIGSAGLVVAFDSVDRRLRSVRQAETTLPAPVRAAIPQPLGSVTAAMLPRVTEVQPISLHAEAYRSLGSHMLASRAHSVMISSVNANQGCTNTVSNLAITLAQAGHRVVVVDANVRAPRLHEVFEISNDFGFTSLLEDPGNGSLQEALHHTSLPNLWVIPSGPAPKNVWGLFQASRTGEVTARLREFADYVIYDTPSALAFTDALNLAPVVEAAYLCVRALQPSTGAERRLVDALAEARVMVLGTVLTDVPASVLETYTTYQRYYPNTPAALPRATAVTGAAPREPGASSWIDDQENDTRENSL